MALKKAGVFASNRNIYYEMIENRTIAASSKWAWWNIKFQICSKLSHCEDNFDLKNLKKNPPPFFFFWKTRMKICICYTATWRLNCRVQTQLWPFVGEWVNTMAVSIVERIFNVLKILKFHNWCPPLAQQRGRIIWQAGRGLNWRARIYSALLLVWFQSSNQLGFFLRATNITKKAGDFSL